MFLLPKSTWAVPVLQPPPHEIVDKLRKAIAGTSTTWWCAARWWAERLEVHPILACSIRALSARNTLENYTGHRLEWCLQRHAESLDLELLQVSHSSIWLRPTERADARVAASAIQVTGAAIFDGLTQEGAHVIRVAARAKVLGTIVRRRHDSEGAAQIDLEAQSSRQWKRFLAAMSPQKLQTVAIIRGGAMWSNTRRYYKRQPEKMCCSLCGAQRGSIRHYLVDCPHQAGLRETLAARYQTSPEWWARQPRITTKTGWITTMAGDSVERRAQLECMVMEALLEVFNRVRPDEDH